MKNPTPHSPSGKQPEQVPPTEQTEPSLQHPTDQSWVLQILLDLQKSFGRIDERTKNLAVMTEDIKEDVRTIRNKQGEFVTEKFAWRISALLVSVIGIIVAVLAGVIYYVAENHTHLPPP